MQKQFGTDTDFREAMLMWSEDFNSNRLYGEGRWKRLGKKAEALSDDWGSYDEWDELSPEDIVTFAAIH